MPWKLVHNHPACHAGEWAVVNEHAEAEGRHSIEGCHATRTEALAQQRALYAKEPKMAEQLTVPIEWKSGDPGTGILKGHASVFGNVDLGGDVVLPGAFRKTLADWARSKRRIPLLIDHKMSTDGLVGSLDYAREDAVGLDIGARFSSIQKAQDIRTLMREGHLDGLSFTYDPVKAHRGMKGDQQVRFLEEMRLFEATITPFPMNILALGAAKAADPSKPYGDVAYADPGYQEDGKKRYPLDTEAHCRAAWSYINQADNAAKYSAEELARIKGRIKAALKRYGVQVSESSSLDFAAFAELARKALEIGHEVAAKAAFDALLTDYTTLAAGQVDEPPTADDAAPTDPASAGDTSLADDPSAYALRIITPPGPRDDAPDSKPPSTLADPLIPLEVDRQNDQADRLEEEITQALRRATA